MVREQRRGMNKTHIINTFRESCREKWQALSFSPPFLVPSLPWWPSQLWLARYPPRNSLQTSSWSHRRCWLPSLQASLLYCCSLASFLKTPRMEWHKWQQRRETHKNGNKMLHNDKWKAITVMGGAHHWLTREESRPMSLLTIRKICKD